MKNNRLENNKTVVLGLRLPIGLFVLFFLCASFSFAQVKTEIDTTKIRIGEQINYKIKVEADSLALVVFPEGQTFMPLELVEALDIDTTKQDAKFLLSRIYKLTQFDSGAYTIPQQKIIIGKIPFFTDSLRVDVNTIVVDTTKQKLFDIKPIIQVNKSSSTWWLWLLGVLAVLALVAFLLYWFIWRKKPLTEEEEIALLPPYDRAQLALKKLDESQYLIRAEVKEYYSELTFIIRKYLDEKVYDRALESTTSQLIARLQLLKEGNQIDLSKDTIKNIESILRRADLVKFAKSAPDMALAEMDKATISKEIDVVKAGLPEPTEEEKLLDEQYREILERKKKRKKVILTVAISVFLIIATFVGFGLKYGFGYVKDTIIGHESKELLEGEWVKSEYGFPPVYIETPRVLKRIDSPLPEGAEGQMTMTTFSYSTMLDIFSVTVNTTTLKTPKQQAQTPQTDGEEKTPTFDLLELSEAGIKGFESKGATDITVKRDQFITPNAAEGLKTYGTLNIKIPNTDRFIGSEYAFLQFGNDNVLQQIVLTWPKDDTYADEMIQRIIDSIELNPNEQEPEN
ncbi:hypothetical protein OAE03_01625 [Winogradskyella sp.]|nr:hypothetical protein [Winogradskyella sp.]MDB9782216.1 hypothetical protein [Winogradskyella sp.]MDC0006591.1 hypothetical protein [Winogradskyella sp.]MDC0009238.1 hypothetical protein [Winogradskyella sp.]MDC1505684.1 hypothetical protein [Winogradskyella sp.]